MNNRMKQCTIGLLSLLLLATNAIGKEKKVAQTTPELLQEIRIQDSVMFAAFNTQNMGALKAFFATELEWFQDNAGQLNYDTVFLNFSNNFKKGNKLTRTLMPGTLEVHPIKNYGAIETGMHQFRHMENSKEEVGTFKFMMIWKKSEDGKWRITKVISYDH